jgi:hypothetical protein
MKQAGRSWNEFGFGQLIQVESIRRQPTLLTGTVGSLLLLLLL